MKNRFVRTFLRQSSQWLAMAVLYPIMASCTDSDDYKKYLEGGEIVYPQKADSLKTFPGRNRILLEWVSIDPKVMTYAVYYSQGGVTDSIFVAAVHSEAYSTDTMHLIIDGLEETGYKFKILAYDRQSHVSIPVETEETVYGSLYESLLLNRGIEKITLENHQLTVRWYGSFEGEAGVKSTYRATDNTVKTRWIPAGEDTTVINDFADYDAENLHFSYQTLYLPVKTAIDTFAAPVTTVSQSILPIALFNAVAPFAVTDDGYWEWARFGTAAEWTHSPSTGYLTVDNLMGNRMVLMSGYGLNGNVPMANGKIYQTLSLPAGTYRFRVHIHWIAGTSGNIVYVVAAQGITLPDTETLTVDGNVLDYDSRGEWAMNTDVDCEFTLTDPVTTVSLGIVANIWPNSDVQISSFSLEKSE
ncbi:MAG: DUF5013 domain-containing protein [Bacteroidales bacterium]|nr:DUF5013 domain-containing protein [Bacteroidales bacterium]